MYRNFSQVLILVLASVIVSSSPLEAAAAKGPLVLTVTAARDSFLPGEAVELTVSLANQSEQSVKAALPEIENCTISLYLARGDEGFRRYQGPEHSSRGEINLHTLDLGSGEEFRTKTTMLYHQFVSQAHLNPLYRSETEIDDFFAISRPGRYRVKAVYSDQTGSAEIESSPFEFDVLKPGDDDAQFWKAVRTDRDAAYFMHTGKLPLVNADRLLEKMSNLSRIYPTSVHAARFVESRRQN